MVEDGGGMSHYGPYFDYDEELKSETDALLKYGITSEEAHVLAVGIVAPQTWDMILKEE